MLSKFGTIDERIFSVANGCRPGTISEPTGWSAERDDDPETIVSPIFLVGSVRSGTTLLRLMLDHHPELAFHHESQYMVEKLPETGWPDLGAFYEGLVHDRIFQDSRFTIDRRLNYRQLMNSFLAQKRDRDGKRLVGSTVHLHFDRLLRIWPDARFIHIVRDGRDVARSRVELGWAGNMYTGVDSWIEAERLWEKFRDQVAPDRRIDIRYEDLISDAPGELSRICDFLDLPYDPAMLRYNQNSTYQPPDLSLINQWRRKLSPTAVRLAESRIADMLVDRGYELSGHKRLKNGPIFDRLMRLDDRRNRLKMRRRAYGNRLFLAELASRTLEPLRRKLTDFRINVRERINEVERASLK